MKYNDRSEFEKVDSFGIGAPNDAYAQYFTGNSFLKPLTEFGKAPVFMANVTFEPKCRNNCHIPHQLQVRTIHFYSFLLDIQQLYD